MSEQEPVGISESELGSRVELGDKPARAVSKIFIGQLAHLVRLRKTAEEELNPRGIRLVDDAIVARIRDLNGLGYKEQVSQITNSPKTPQA